MTTISLIGQKGGSGKSTTAINLAAEWVRRGLNVLLVDTDPQGTARTWGDVAQSSGQASPAVVAMGSNLHHNSQLPTVGQNFDLVIVDCPPNNGEISRSAMMVSDLAIIPCGPSAPDAWALSETVSIVNQAQMLRPQLKAHILITRVNFRTTIGNSARDVLQESGLPILDTTLGYRVGYQEAPAAGMGVTQYDPRGAVAREIKGLIDEIENILGFEEVQNEKAI